MLRTRALVVALLLAVSGGVAVQSSGPGGRVGKTPHPVAIPKHSSPATPPSNGSAPTEEVLPPAVATPLATPSFHRATQAPVRLDAPVLAPQPQSLEAPSPGPVPALTLTPPPEQAPPPPTPTPPPAIAAVRISIGEGDRGVVVALSIPSEPAESPRPDVDVTVGRTPLVGDAPPSAGTGVDVSAAEADTVSNEAAFVTKINDLRTASGLPALQVNENLVAKARAWSAEMASAGGIRHSTLSDGITEGWKKLGENVGMGASVGRLHAEFVASPPHYEKLVDPAFGYVGVGVVRNGDTIYVSEVFMQLMPPKPAPG